MTARNTFGTSLGVLLIGLAMTGCGSSIQVRMNPKNQTGPWCAANQRVQAGSKTTGREGYYGPYWTSFWLDEKNKEVDVGKIDDQARSYLEQTGVTKKLLEALHKDKYDPVIHLCSIHPIIGILQPAQYDPARGKVRDSDGKEIKPTIYFTGEDMLYKEGMQWFSPDLKQKLTNISFSEAGVAEIPLAHGKIKLTRVGDKCKISRE